MKRWVWFDRRDIAGVEVESAVGEPGEGGLLLGDRYHLLSLDGEARGVTVAPGLVGVVGEAGKRGDMGEIRTIDGGLRLRGRKDGGCLRLLSARVFGLSSAAKSGSTEGSMLASRAKLVSSGPSASMTTALSVLDQSKADAAGESAARIASITSRVNCAGFILSIDVSASPSNEVSGSEDSFPNGLVGGIGRRNAGFRMVGDGLRDSGGDESVLNMGTRRETPELSASMMVDNSWDSGIPGEGVRRTGAESEEP